MFKTNVVWYCYDFSDYTILDYDKVTSTYLIKNNETEVIKPINYYGVKIEGGYFMINEIVYGNYLEFFKKGGE